MNKKYSIGIDFGSLSGRALLVEVDTGREVACSVSNYKHGFIEETLPATGESLPSNWTIQDPQDYLDVLSETIWEVLNTSKVSPNDVIGIGIDFTCCTVMPIKKDGTPLCFLPEYRSNKHAYVKVWKHHAAQDEANKLNAIAHERGEKFIQRYGGKISSEWLFPKIWQVLDEAPEVYEEMDRFIKQETGLSCSSLAVRYAAVVQLAIKLSGASEMVIHQMNSLKHLIRDWNMLLTKSFHAILCQ
jgi:L-ribulokinase